MPLNPRLSSSLKFSAPALSSAFAAHHGDDSRFSSAPRGLSTEAFQYGQILTHLLSQAKIRKSYIYSHNGNLPQKDIMRFFAAIIIF